MRIDHVIWGTSDLAAAAARFESEGLTVEPGGAHAGIGTHNRIVPLGGQYVELLAILDPEMAAGSDLGRTIAARIAGGDGWMGWSVAVDDAAAHAARLGASLIEVARRGTPHARLAAWVGGAELPVAVVAGPAAITAVTIRGRRL